MSNLYKELVTYSESDFYGFHMPGHKRNAELTGVGLPYQIDITEIDGFDDLHHADGVLKAAQERAAQLYKADETSFLINGSTAGILSGIMGSTQKGDKILMARNCHKSAYHAVFLNELKPIYLYPRYYNELELNGPIEVQDVMQALECNADIRVIMITSPTYDGVVSDVAGIARIAHSKGIPLIVDEAHGAHFGFHPYFPENSNTLGADVVIHSLHKTLPALTQTALLHMNGTLVDKRGIRQYLHMFQTSSPSYILMASIDVCMEMLSARGQDWFENYVDMLKEVRSQLNGLENLKFIEPGEHNLPVNAKPDNVVVNCDERNNKHKSKMGYDKSKIVISVKGTDWGSKQLYESLLQEYHLQMEMAAGSYVLAMTSLGDTKEGFIRLVKALKEIDKQVRSVETKEQADFFLPKLRQVYTCAQIRRRISAGYNESGQCRLKRVNLDGKDGAGCISTEYAYIYPPGIPIVVPGEEITEEVMMLLQKYMSLGFSIEGLEAEKWIEVWING